MLGIAAIIAGIIGIIGSIIPGLPGPPVSWIGLLLLYIRGAGASGEPMGFGFLMVWLAVTVVISIADYVVPIYFTKLTGGGKLAGRGALIGLLAGLIFSPIGIIMGTLLGAFLAELLFDGKSGWESLKSALGALAGFLFGTGMKLICSCLMMYHIIQFIR